MSDDKAPLNLDAYRTIGELRARCEMLEARVAALTAFACAMLETSPRCDELQTRWGKHLGPALNEFAGLEKVHMVAGPAIPAWVMYHLQGEPSADTN